MSHGSLDRLALDDDARRRLRFLVTALGLTSVTRVNRLLDGSRGETSAEHSWHLALAAVVLGAGTADGVDLAHVVAMLLVHDLVEIDAGDVPIYDAHARAAAAEGEERAAARLFGLLPPEEAEEQLALWREFEAAESPEARFARALDRLQPILVHWAGDGAAWIERGITEAQERELVAVVEEHWAPLAPLASALVDDAARRGLLS
jgi:putative hydrolase of HD superfamily